MNASKTLKLYMIPALGCDYRMYKEQLDDLPNLIIPEWLPLISKSETLPEYSKRLAMYIDTSEPFMLSGVSFGSMVAEEMAKHIKPEALILISSCHSYKGIRTIFRLSGRIAARMPGFILWPFIVSFTFLALHIWPLPQVKHKATYIQMAEDFPIDFFKWQIRTAVNWHGNIKHNMPVYRIHGAKDKLMPIDKVNTYSVILALKMALYPICNCY